MPPPLADAVIALAREARSAAASRDRDPDSVVRLRATGVDLDRALSGGGAEARHLAAMYRHTLRRLGHGDADVAALRLLVGDLEVLRDAWAALELSPPR